MSWKSDKAIERTVKVFKRANTKIFEEDIDAIKTISETIEYGERKLMTDNVLFAKLVAYVVNQHLHNSGSMKDAVSCLNNALSKPLDDHLTFLTSNLNTQEHNNFLKSIGINFGSLDDETEKIKAHEKEIIEKIQSNWTKEKTTKSFCNTVNEFLRDTDNYI